MNNEEFLNEYKKWCKENKKEANVSLLEDLASHNKNLSKVNHMSEISKALQSTSPFSSTELPEIFQFSNETEKRVKINEIEKVNLFIKSYSLKCLSEIKYENSTHENTKGNTEFLERKFPELSPDLEDELYAEAKEISSILKNDFSIDNYEFPEIIFESRNEMLQEWVKDIIQFFKDNISALSIEYCLELKEKISDEYCLELKEKISDSYNQPQNSEIYQCLLRGLRGIYEYNHDLLEECFLYTRKIVFHEPVVMPVSGLYEHSTRTIYLYLENIKDDANKNKCDFRNCIYDVFAHEFIHYVHLSKIHDWKDVNKYDPSAIVMESLASWFEAYYAEVQLHDNTLAEAVRKGWEHDVDVWPYSGAKFINDKEEFKEIFETSLTSMENARQKLK